MTLWHCEILSVSTLRKVVCYPSIRQLIKLPFLTLLSTICEVAFVFPIPQLSFRFLNRGFVPVIFRVPVRPCSGSGIATFLFKPPTLRSWFAPCPTVASGVLHLENRILPVVANVSVRVLFDPGIPTGEPDFVPCPGSAPIQTKVDNRSTYTISSVNVPTDIRNSPVNSVWVCYTAPKDEPPL